jgi:hypothetical protein
MLDITALRKTPLGEQLLGGGRTVAGLGEIGTLCGSDPMDAVQQLAIAVPANKDDGFGVFALGNFKADQMLACAEIIVTERQGKPVRQPRGRFGVLRDASQALSSAELAVADGGPLIIGEPSYVAASLALESGKGQTASASPAHSRLRELIEPGVLAATVVFSDEQRSTLLEELRLQHMADSPFAAVKSAALSVRLGEMLRLHGVLTCESAGACKAIAGLIAASIQTEAQSKTAMAVGLSGALQKVSIEPARLSVHLRLDMPLEQASAVLQKLLLLRRLRRTAGETPPPVPAVSAIPGLATSAGERIEAPARPKP